MNESPEDHFTWKDAREFFAVLLVASLAAGAFLILAFLVAMAWVG
jgi:hypothetical protein